VFCKGLYLNNNSISTTKSWQTIAGPHQFIHIEQLKNTSQLMDTDWAQAIQEVCV
jgi:hypothetical protein